MLRKLLFSVLVLSLFVAFTGTAFSGTRTPSPDGVDVKILNQPIKTDRDLVKVTIDKPQNSKSFTITEQGMDMPYPTPYAPDHECEILDLIDYSASAYYSFDMVGVLDDGFHVSNRFEVQEFHSAVVNGAAIRIYETSAAGLDLILNVWDDAGGVPGALLYSETVPAATLVANGNGHWIFSFASGIAVPGASYHISYEAVGTDEAEYVTFGIAQNGDGGDNGTSNASFDGGATWMTLTDAFGGFALNARLSSDVCYVYSDCYWASSGLQYFIAIPYSDIGLTDGIWSGIGQQFEAINDTLKTVTVAFYNHYDEVTQVYTPTTQTNACEVKVWADDGAGNIDLAGPLFTYTIPAGVANMFPVTNEDRTVGSFEYHDIPVTGDLVFRGFYHVTAQMVGSDAANGQVHILIEDYAAGGSVAYNSTDNWESTFSNATWLTEFWGNGNGFYFQTEMCRDEYQDCQHQVLYTAPDWGSGFSLAWDADGDGVFDASGTGDDGNYHLVAQKVKARDANRIESARFLIANNHWYSGDPIGSMAVQFHVYNEVTDIYDDLTPGTAIWSSDIMPIDDASAWNSWGELWVDVVIPDVLMNGDFWIGYEAHNLGGERIRGANGGDWGPSNVNGGGWLFYNPWQEWISVGLFSITVNNWFMSVDFCSVPQPEFPCLDPQVAGPMSDWGTLQGNYQRTGHSYVGIGNAKCELTLEWNYAHPDGKLGQGTGPIIVNNTIVATFRGGTTEYKTFDLITKIEGYTLTMDGDVTGMTTVDGGVMYVSGGTPDQIVVAYDFATGAEIYTISTTNALGTALSMGSDESNPYANFIIWNDGVDDILYFSVDIGKVYAVYAVDGTPYWAGAFTPTGFGSVSNRTGTSDGNGTLFYGYSAVVGGDVIALDALTGAQLWSLATNNGLEGNNAYDGGVTIEQFQAGIAYDASDHYIYAMSTCAGSHPIAGVLYQINAGTGTIVNPAVPVNGVSNTLTPVIDVQNVLVPTRSVWREGPNSPASLQVFRKSDMTFVFGTGWGDDSNGDYMNGDILMTCEFEADDLIFFLSRWGVLHCVNGNTGEDLFARRVSNNDNRGGAAGAIALDDNNVPHLVYQDGNNNLFDLTPQSSRARLEVLRGNDPEAAARGAVPFGSDPNFEVEFTSVFSNTGCEDLDVIMTITLLSNETPTIPYKSMVADFGSDITQTNFKVSTASMPVAPLEFKEIVSYEKPVQVNPAPLALGFILDEVIAATAPADDDPQNVSVFVDQLAVGRGVFPRFMSFTTHNDPDFWLDDDGTYLGPEVMLTFLGGCILESTNLYFGFDQANEQLVFNSGRLVEGGIGGFFVDGYHEDYPDNGMLYQGMYIFGTSPQNQAWTIVSWIEGAGESSTWNSWLPELIEGQCVPLLTEAVSFGNYSSDGLDYSATLIGNSVAYNSIDSVQDFSDTATAVGDGWNHTNFIAPYSNDLTMGLTIEHQTIGLYEFGFDTLNPGAGILDDMGQGTLEIFDFHERNGNAVSDWKFANYYDWDIGSEDTALVLRSASLAWTFDATDAGSAVGGSVKIPFNFCSNTADPEYLAPMKLAVTLAQNQGMWGDMSSGGPNVWFLDSMNFYANLPWDSTDYCQIDYTGGTQPDQASSYIIAEHDFEPSGSYRVGVFNFQIQNYNSSNKNTARMAALAHTVNKWMGFGRGDVNNDNVIDLMDIIYLSNYATGGGGPGPIPFEYLGDVNVDGATDLADVTLVADYYFNNGGCFGGAWTL